MSCVGRERIFEHFDLVRDVAGNLHHLAGPDDCFAAVDPEQQHPADDDADAPPVATPPPC